MTKQLSNGFKRSVYWNSYQTIPAKVIDKGTNIYKLLSASFQGAKRLFVLAYVIAASAIDTRIQKKIQGSGKTTLIISNEEMNDITKIVQALEDSNILLKGITKTIEKETKNKKEDF